MIRQQTRPRFAGRTLVHLRGHDARQHQHAEDEERHLRHGAVGRSLRSLRASTPKKHFPAGSETVAPVPFGREKNRDQRVAAWERIEARIGSAWMVKRAAGGP